MQIRNISLTEILAFFLCPMLLLTASLTHGHLSDIDSYLSKAFDDSIIYRLSWDKEPDEILKNQVEAQEIETITMVTNRKEKYQCAVPQIMEKKEGDAVPYDGPNALELLAPLFNQLSCSYKLEAYWTYEVCHGRYIRQYHEEREGKKIKLQEYFLGKWDKDQMQKQSAEMEAEAKSGKVVDIPVRRVESLMLPYLLITMTDGTVCDINGKPRVTRVYYVCYPAGKHEIFSLEEVSTCEYEVVILTPFLCQHPDYRAKESEENKITCWPLEGSPRRPIAQMELDAESQKLRQQSLLDSLGLSDAGFTISFRQVNALGEEQAGEKRTVAFISTKNTDDEKEPASSNSPAPQDTPKVSPPPQPVFDPKLVEDFLSGQYCLHGGAGWWKYEFCYGRKVDQYHEEKDGTKQVNNLGRFNKEKHLSWLEQNPSKRPKPGTRNRKQISHMYTDGAVCDETGQLRRVEVKLKCKEVSQQQQQLHSLNAVSLYLLEPQTCDYVLGVEAPFLCPLIDLADQDGFIDVNQLKSDSKQPVAEPVPPEDKP